METMATTKDRSDVNDFPTPSPSAPLRPPDPEKPPLDHPHQPRPLRRRCFLACLCCLSLVVILALVVVILAFTLFKPRSPTTTLISSTVTGVSPAISPSAVQINVSLYLEIAVYNPNRASFDHGQGETGILYRGTGVGSADLAPGRIPARGSAVVRCNATLQADKFTSQLSGLLTDVVAGEMGLDTTSRIPGRVTFLGFIKKHAVAVADCRVVVGLPDLRVKRQDCSQKTKL